METEELLGGGGPIQGRREERERPPEGWFTPFRASVGAGGRERRKKKALGAAFAHRAEADVGAIADVTGDPARAREMAARSHAEKMLAAYLTYDEVKARRNVQRGKNGRGAAAEDARGDPTLPDGAARRRGARVLAARSARDGPEPQARQGRGLGCVTCAGI